MSTSQPAPLGLYDLNEDECLIVSISRAWRKLGPTRSVAEHSIARLLQTDRVYPALDALFAAFVSLFAAESARAGDAADHESDLLSESEETLLDQLSAETPPDWQKQEVRACQTALRQARIELRPLGTIERSGHDSMMQRLTVSYQLAMRLPH
ncbi:MAG: hypothetical protein AAGN66_14345 [Acidobacteriota bacterium]